jgi:hypothetical protein
MGDCGIACELGADGLFLKKSKKKKREILENPQ